MVIGLVCGLPDLLDQLEAGLEVLGAEPGVERVEEHPPVLEALLLDLALVEPLLGIVVAHVTDRTAAGALT
jgi:hypothetical protein